ncbi:MAG: glycosyltransferase family 39 protein [Verrucomicrobiae bacterium]|nr:glycosyltransferase family 39 protein [Verrucomicrobiae bacterium]
MKSKSEPTRDAFHFAVWAFALAVFALGGLGRWQSLWQFHDLTPGKRVNLTFDEIVFLKLAGHLRSDPLDYELRDWYRQLERDGRAPPAYLNDPIFKHPPVVPWLLSSTFVPEAPGVLRSLLWMMLFGVGITATVYGIARTFLEPSWSALAAAFAWLDPFLWVGSVKVWLDLPLAFFCSVAVFAALRGRRYPPAFLWMGLALGLAFLTKYVAIVPWIGLAWWGFVRDPHLRRNRCFQIGMLIPWLMVAPWLAWCFKTSGGGWLNQPEAQYAIELIRRFALGGAVIAALIAIVWRTAPPKRSAPDEPAWNGRLFLGALFALCLAGLLFFPSWFSGRVEPRSGFQVLTFGQEGREFYLGRILNLNPLLWPALLALIWPKLPEPAGLARTIAIAVIAAFTLWGNFQSRYMMPAMPLLCVLSVWSLRDIAAYLREEPDRWLARAWFAAWAGFAILRLAWVHSTLSMPNQFTYF